MNLLRMEISLAVGIGLFVGGLLIGCFLTKEAENVFKIAELKEGTQPFEDWRQLDVRLHITAFNLTNPNEFNLGEKPVFQSVGPYVYKEVREYENVIFNENGTISYTENKKFVFVPELSSGSETDKIITINLPLFLLGVWMEPLPIGARDYLLQKYSEKWPSFFAENISSVHSVHEMFWGYNTSGLTFWTHRKNGVMNSPLGPFGKFATETNGHFNIFSGRDSIANYGLIDCWNGATKLPFWKKDDFNQVTGASSGVAFPPGIAKEATISVFYSELCRTLPLVFQKEVEHNGINGYRFVPSRGAIERDDGERFCPSNSVIDDRCDVKGLFKVGPCKLNFPLAISWPHFTHGEKNLLDAVIGLQPDEEKYKIYFDLHPKLATPIGAKMTFQMNAILKEVPGWDKLKGIRDMIFPLFWVESITDGMSEDVAEKMRYFLICSQCAWEIPLFMFGTSAIILLFVGITWLNRGDRDVIESRVNSVFYTGESAQIFEDRMINEEIPKFYRPPVLPPVNCSLSPQQILKRSIMESLFSTENSYVASLNLVNDYKKSLEGSSPQLLSSREIDVLFLGVENILKHHMLFGIALYECARSWDECEKIGDIFVQNFSNTSVLEDYSAFINNFSFAMDKFKYLCDRNAAFNDFMEEKQRQSPERLTFFDLMIKPVQRFPQLLLVLKDLIKQTSEEHSDRIPLEKALARLELIALELNARKRNAERVGARVLRYFGGLQFIKN